MEQAKKDAAAKRAAARKAKSTEKPAPKDKSAAKPEVKPTIKPAPGADAAKQKPAPAPESTDNAGGRTATGGATKASPAKAGSTAVSKQPTSKPTKTVSPPKKAAA